MGESLESYIHLRLQPKLAPKYVIRPFTRRYAESLKDYLEKYPDGEFVKEAKENIKESRCQEAIVSKSIQKLESFLEEYQEKLEYHLGGQIMMTIGAPVLIIICAMVMQYSHGLVKMRPETQSSLRKKSIFDTQIVLDQIKKRSKVKREGSFS